MSCAPIMSIVNEIAQKSTEVDGVVLLGEAYHACNPNREHGWSCDAVRVDASRGVAEFGKVHWDFELDLDDPSDYNWDYCGSDFVVNDTYDLNDAGEKGYARRELLNYRRVLGV